MGQTYREVPYGSSFTFYYTLRDNADDPITADTGIVEAGDVLVSLNGGAFSATGLTLGVTTGGQFSVTLDATRMQNRHIVVKVEDATATPVFATEEFLILTSGNASAFHPNGFAELATQALLTTVDGKVDLTATQASLDALNDISVNDILTATTEGAETLVEAIRLMRAALVGLASNNGTTFRDAGDTKNRITATVDEDGNRTAVTTDATP